MDRWVPELFLTSLLAAFCGGLARIHDHELFAAAFAAAAVFAAALELRRAAPQNGRAPALPVRSALTITAFCDKIAELSPRLVTFNGHSFDLPVLRYRAMVHGVSAPGLSARP